jgi:carbon starvation protein
MRNRGQTVGEVAGRLITPRARLLFLLILFFSLTIVLAIFGLVIASIFKLYPAAVFSVWIEIPIAVAIGFWVYKRNSTLLLPSLLALGLLYLAVYIGAYHFPIELPGSWGSPIVIWTLILMVYCFVASVLPVWTLMQPRDYINSHQLVVALGLLVMGLFLAGISGDANLDSAPAVADIQKVRESGAPPILPFLFITIACGAISGFHCLVSSGTSSKQIESETDAQYVGYGAMLLEGALAVIVILACCAGLGMGAFAKAPEDAPNEGMLLVHSKTGDHYHIQTVVVSAEGKQTAETLTGRPAWKTSYDIDEGWGAFNSLSKKIGAFIEGGANFLHALKIPFMMGVTIMAVLVASFAATTLDTATRLQRYVIQELGSTLHIAPLRNKYLATGLAVVLGGALAMVPAPGGGAGTGGLILWPLFGATNQLLAGLAFMVIVFYLWRRNKPIWFAFIPMLIMLVMPAWALIWQLFNSQSGWLTADKNYLLGSIGLGTLCLQVWMVVEGLMIWRSARGVLEEALPPLEDQPVAS